MSVRLEGTSYFPHVGTDTTLIPLKTYPTVDKAFEAGFGLLGQSALNLAARNAGVDWFKMNTVAGMFKVMEVESGEVVASWSWNPHQRRFVCFRWRKE